MGFRNHPLVPELTRSRLLDNLRAVQIRNNLKPSDSLAGPGINLTIEMETGTGKTYTYVKTMYELNRRYGTARRRKCKDRMRQKTFCRHQQRQRGLQRGGQLWHLDAAGK